MDQNEWWSIVKDVVFTLFVVIGIGTFTSGLLEDIISFPGNIIGIIAFPNIDWYWLLSVIQFAYSC